jgi:hypothetical protein
LAKALALALDELKSGLLKLFEAALAPLELKPFGPWL